jgi:hypothetical protein
MIPDMVVPSVGVILGDDEHRCLLYSNDPSRAFSMKCPWAKGMFDAARPDPHRATAVLKALGIKRWQI